MKYRTAMIAFASACVMVGVGRAATPLPPAVADFGAIVDVPGAQQRPDPNAHYSVVFGVTKAAAKPDQPNPSLDRVARFVNLLSQHGVPRSHWTIVAIVYGPATNIVAKGAAGAPVTADARLIAELSAAGVQVAVCSQAAHGHDLAAGDLLPNVRMDVSAITTIAILQGQGYAYLPD